MKFRFEFEVKNPQYEEDVIRELFKFAGPHTSWHKIGPISPVHISEKFDFVGFANEILRIAWDGNDIDGGTAQELADKYGLIQEVTVTEPCGEHCQCAELAEFPTKCYRKTY